MPSYVVMRCAKLKTIGNIAGSLSHNFRERPTANADHKRTPDNIYVGGDTAEATLNKIKALLPDKIRKNGVLCIEYLFTASPEFFASTTKEQQNEFYKSCEKWLIDKYGQDNLMQLTVHKDETTPHLVAYIVPLKDGKLNAKHYIGGTRDTLRQDQTDIAKRVEHLGLTRGIEGSKATHIDLKKYYSMVNTTKAVPKGLFAGTKQRDIDAFDANLYRTTKKDLERQKSDLRRKLELESKEITNARRLVQENERLKNKNNELTSQLTIAFKNYERAEEKANLMEQARNDAFEERNQLREQLGINKQVSRGFRP